LLTVCTVCNLCGPSENYVHVGFDTPGARFPTLAAAFFQLLAHRA
jgi:hypothetical protein